MENKKWKKFGKLTEQCYRNMIGAEKDSSCWEKAFELLMEIVREERQKEPNWCQEYTCWTKTQIINMIFQNGWKIVWMR